MLAKNMNTFDTFGHKHYEEENNVKSAQNKLKKMQNSDLAQKMLKSLLESSFSGGLPIRDVCKTIEDYNVSDWCVLENGDSMSEKLELFVQNLLTQEDCNKVIYFNQNKKDNLWIILNEENFETSIRYIELVENSISEYNLQFEYLFFDNDDIDEVYEQLDMMKVDFCEYK